MKVYVETIEVNNPELMRNIVHALESTPIDGGSYEVTCTEIDKVDSSRGGYNGRFRLDVFRNEIV